MKIIKKLSIFVITCVFAIAMYFAFGVERVDADDQTTTPTYDYSGFVTLTNDFVVTINISTNSVAGPITSYKYTYYTMVNQVLTSNSTAVNVTETSYNEKFIINVAAPAIFEDITININGDYNITTSVATILLAEKNQLLTSSGASTNKSILCCDLILYGYYAAKYFSTIPTSQMTTNYSNWDGTIGINNNGKIDQNINDEYNELLTDINAANLNYSMYQKKYANNSDDVRITGINFDCSYKCKLYIYISGSNLNDLTNYTISMPSTSLNYSYSLEDKNTILKVTIDYNFKSLLDYTGTGYILDPDGKQICEFNVCALSYAYLVTKKYQKTTNELVYLCYSLCRVGRNANTVATGN